MHPILHAVIWCNELEIFVKTQDFARPASKSWVLLLLLLLLLLWLLCRGWLSAAYLCKELEGCYLKNQVKLLSNYLIPLLPLLWKRWWPGWISVTSACTHERANGWDDSLNEVSVYRYMIFCHFKTQFLTTLPMRQCGSLASIRVFFLKK
jgi:hypothetical protein